MKREVVERLRVKIREKDSRLSSHWVPGDDGEDDSLSIYLDGTDTGVYLQLGCDYIYAHRIVETPKIASLHLPKFEELDEETAVQVAVHEALTNERRDEYINQGAAS